jgi:hypothetical protein
MSKKFMSLLLTVLMAFSAIPVGTSIFNAETTASAYTIGDVDNSSTIDVLDAVLIQKYVVKLRIFSDIQVICADVNKDNNVDIHDATLIQKYIVGLSGKHYIGEAAITESSTESTTESTTVSATESTTESTTVSSTDPATETTTDSITEPTTEVNEDAWKDNTGIIKLGSTIEVTGDGAYVDGNTVYITEGGDWEVTGTLDDGMIYVNTGEVKDVNDKVKLRLNGMSLTNKSGPAIYFDRCKKAFITLESGSKNTLCDGSTYSTENADAKATLHSDDSLEIKGKGTLNVTGNYKHGINCDDDINIENGVFNITSATDGIHANDNITVNGKNVNIDITSSADGMESEGDIVVALGTVKVNAQGKGVKAQSDMNITGGTFNITSVDDTVHSNSNINISDGNFTLSSGDDGIHADSTININGGSINVLKSYEGIESTEVNINAGTISVVSSDDGINGAGGNDSSSVNGRPGQNNFRPGQSGSSTGKIVISGGYIFVLASGDGIDSNGTLEVTGGTTIVEGPSTGGNSCLDTENGITYTGGTVLGISTSNAMWSQDVIGHVTGSYIYKTSLGSVASDGIIAVTDSSGNVLSAVKSKLSGSLGIIYMTDKTSSLSSCSFSINGSYSGSFDSNGYGEGGTITGGTKVTPTQGSNSNGNNRPF